MSSPKFLRRYRRIPRAGCPFSRREPYQPRDGGHCDSLLFDL